MAKDGAPISPLYPMLKSVPKADSTASAAQRADEQLAAASESVEILALTTDHELLTTLRAGVHPKQQRIWHAPGFTEAAELIMAGRVGVAVIDTRATREQTIELC